MRGLGGTALNYSEVVKTVYFDPIDIELEDKALYFIFKAEILKDAQQHYRIRLYERELYTMKPAFFEHHSTESLWIESTFPVNADTILEPTPERALEVLIERLKSVLPSASKENNL